MTRLCTFRLLPDQPMSRFTTPMPPRAIPEGISVSCSEDADLREVARMLRRLVDELERQAGGHQR